MNFLLTLIGFICLVSGLLTPELLAIRPVYARPLVSGPPVIPPGYFSALSVPQKSAVVLFDIQSGEELYSVRGDTPLKPASVLKLLTSLAALEKFDPYYRIKTEVKATGLKGNHVDTLFVKGYGDPNFTQESLWLLARKIHQRGVRSIGKLVLDDSYFVGSKGREGQRAYEAGSSALSLNFNSIQFEVCPIPGRKKAVVTHDPYEVPIHYTGAITVTSRNGSFQLDEVRMSDQGPFPLRYNLKGRIGSRVGCQEVYRTVSDPTMYYGKVLSGMLHREGIRKGFPMKRGIAPKKAATVHTFRSEPLHQIVRDLNTYSNNMIAEQLLMLLGEGRDGHCERNRGLGYLRGVLEDLGVPENDFSLHDGSGLSHDNRITARALSRVVKQIFRNDEIDVEFEASLPVDGRSGTLKKRTYEGNTRAKTGTLNGVMSLAGVVQSKKMRKYGFVVIQNKLSSRARGSKLEKKVISLLRAL